MKELKPSYTLKELIDTDNNGIEIPAVQRGLVWSPNQAEFLWDSILRGFPIGGFVVAKSDNDRFYLMDGQQRLDAIQKAYKSSSENSDTIFWIDLFAEKTSGTRKFCIMVITKAHPWGFNSEEESSRLTAGERREAISCFWNGEDKDIYRVNFALRDCFPFKAKFPVQLSYLLNADISNEESFKESVVACIEKNTDAWKSRYLTAENRQKFDTVITSFYDTFKKLSDYRIPISKLDLLDESSPNTNLMHEETELETLFTRLNTGGTRISQDDLFYSAIKAYWGSVKDKIEAIAGVKVPPAKLPPAKLSQLLFR